MMQAAMRVLAILVCSAAVVFAQPQTRPAADPAPPAAGARPAVPAQDAEPGVTQLAIGEPTNIVRLAGPQGTFTVTATVDKLPADLKAYAQTLTLVDRGVLRGSASETVVTFVKADFVGRSGTSGISWQVVVEVRGLQPGTTQVRLAQATLGTPPVPIAFEYTLTSKAAAAPQWDVKGASPVAAISWSGDATLRRYEVMIANQDEPLRNVRPVASTLHDASGRAIGIDRVKVLDGRSAKPIVGPVNLDPNAARPLILEFDRLAHFGDYGTFDGQIKFAADGASTTKDVQVKVQATSAWVKLLGLVLVLVGLLIAGAAAWLRASAARAAAMRPARVLAERVDEFRKELETGCPSCGRMAGAVATLLEALGEKGLDAAGVLPPRWAFVTAPSAADTAANLKTHLEKASQKLVGLTVLLREGILVLKHGTASNKNDLIEELDKAALLVEGQADAKKWVEDVLRKRVAPTPGTPFAPMQTDSPTPAELDHRVTVVAGISWLLWAVISLAVAAVWIASDMDYGSPTDLIGSFLWGVGLTGFGASVQNLTTQNVATTVNIKLS